LPADPLPPNSEIQTNWHPGKEREREKEREKRKQRVVVRDTTFKGDMKLFFSSFEGSQAVPARPPGRGMFEMG
jgi:hypothetical protein